ncbi:MAG: A/G-specific adenine glycosylase [Eubacterium sp.]
MTQSILKNDPQRIIPFSENLLTWFHKAKRNLPFRETKNPYCIWISEIMAQQTQIDTLIPYYHRFTATFPTVQALANAPEESVLKLWEGLGYYSRAKNLHKASKIICSDYGGIFPDHYTELIKLPGIGPYTGGAIASIAYQEKVPAIDGNVLRVIARFNNDHSDIAEPKVKASITHFVTAILPDSPGDFNEALMELGALICTPKNPKCLLCPVNTLCKAYESGTCNDLPVKSKKIKQKKLDMEVAIIEQDRNLYLIKRPPKGLLANLWSFPITEAGKIPGEALTQSLSTTFPNLPKGHIIGTGKHVFSHIIWNMTVYSFVLDTTYFCEASAHYGESQAAFKSRDEMNAVALPVAFSKLLKLL